jgi:tetratricopeptide (TPR) repeat protein
MEDKKLTKWEGLKDYYETLQEQKNQIADVVDMLYTCLGEISRLKEDLRILEEDIETALERQKKISDNIKQKNRELEQKIWKIELDIISDLLGKDNEKVLEFYNKTLIFKQYVDEDAMKWVMEWVIKEHLEEVLKDTLKHLKKYYKANLSCKDELILCCFTHGDEVLWEIEQDIILALFEKDRKKALEFYKKTKVFKKHVSIWAIEEGTIEDLMKEIGRIDDPI